MAQIPNTEPQPLPLIHVTDIRIAEGWNDLSQILEIRNLGVQGMAVQEPIDIEKLLRGFEGQSVYVYEPFSRHRVVAGFGQVRRWHDGVPYASLAVHPNWKGRGLGKFIYMHLRKCWPFTDEIFAICRQENIASIKAAQASGWETTDRYVGDGMVVLKAETIK